MGLTLTEFAHRMGYTIDHVSRVELDKAKAGPRFLRKAADIAKCEVRDLMTDEPTAPERAVA